jgi:hypothetical protein
VHEVAWVRSVHVIHEALTALQFVQIEPLRKAVSVQSVCCVAEVQFTANTLTEEQRVQLALA